MDKEQCPLGVPKPMVVVVFVCSFGCRPSGPSGPMAIVHPVYPLAVLCIHLISKCVECVLKLKHFLHLISGFDKQKNVLTTGYTNQRLNLRPPCYFSDVLSDYFNVVSVPVSRAASDSCFINDIRW